MSLTPALLANPAVRGLMDNLSSAKQAISRASMRNEQTQDELDRVKRERNALARETSRNVHPILDLGLGFVGASGGAVLDVGLERMIPAVSVLPIAPSEGVAALALIGSYWGDMPWLFELAEGPLYAAQYNRTRSGAKIAFDAAMAAWAGTTGT